jgi:hypothetical protein
VNYPRIGDRTGKTSPTVVGGLGIRREGEAMTMEVIVLAIPGCPGALVLERRLAQALEGTPDLMLRHIEITDLAAAVHNGMHGSPTLLVDGRDLFAQPGTGPALACRLYRDENGHLAGAPSVTALLRALEEAGIQAK